LMGVRVKFRNFDYFYLLLLAFIICMDDECSIMIINILAILYN
jgi:hypothetical protein